MSHQTSLYQAFIFKLILLVLLGCETAPTTETPRKIESIQPPAPQKLHLPVSPEILYLDPDASSINLRVYAGGRLARFGHNHIITASSVHGIVYWHPDIKHASFDIGIPVTNLLVDHAQARASAGPDFAKPVSEKDIEGTRRNMLEPKVLDAVNHPFIRIRSVRLWGEAPELTAEVAITIKGVTKHTQVTINLSESGGKLIATGRLQISQQEFGITPFSILGGAIAVQDIVWVDFRLGIAG